MSQKRKLATPWAAPEAGQQLGPGGGKGKEPLWLATGSQIHRQTSQNYRCVSPARAVPLGGHAPDKVQVVASAVGG